MKSDFLSPIIKRCKNSLVKIFTFSPFLVYLAAFITIGIQLLIFEALILEYNEWLNVALWTIIGDLSLILAPYFLLSPRWRWTIWLPIIGFTFFCYANLWYCRAFYDLMPLDSLGMGANMEDRVIDAFFEQLFWIDWLLLLPPLIFGVVIYLLRGKWRINRFPLRAKVAGVLSSLVLMVGSYFNRCYAFYLVEPDLGTYSEMLVNYPKHKEFRSYKLTQRLSYMGYVVYILWQIDNTFFPKTLTEEELRQVEDFWDGQRKRPTVYQQFAANRERNLILIIVESLSADAVGMTVNGVDVAPNLSALASDTGTIVFDRMKPQVSHGRSSDGQFMYNTGLLPLRNNVVAKRFARRNYPSIAKALGYRHASEVIGETPTFYNHSVTNMSYGYNNLLTTYYDNKWLSDSENFERAVKEIERLKDHQPFFCEITTLDMHDPYTHEISSPTAISKASGYDSRDLNYYEQVHIFDNIFGNFIRQLKEMGIYDKSIIVIASDHEPRDTALSENSAIGPNLFFMILNSGRGLKSHEYVGQIDVMPTILDVMGVGTTYKYPGLGRSLVAEPEWSGVIDASGNQFGIKQSSNPSRLEEAWKVSSLMIESNYFK